MPCVAGDYERAVEASNSAAAITSVLYPNDHTTCEHMKLLRASRLLVSWIDCSWKGASFEATVLLDRC